jgi:hypothetical protein
MARRAGIDGHQEDLELMERAFNDDPRVVYSSAREASLLESSPLNERSGDDSASVWRHAQKLIQALSGVVGMNHGLFEELSTVGLYRDDAETCAVDRPDPERAHAMSEARDALGLTNRDVFDDQEFFQSVETNGAVLELAML